MSPDSKELIASFADPLLDRQRLGKPSLGIVYYPGDAPSAAWSEALGDYFRQRGTYMEHLRIADLGDAPAHNLLRRHKAADHLFSIVITPEDLPDAALTSGTSVAMLNIHRDSFRDASLGLLLWVPLQRARRFMDLASNLSDYRTAEMELPSTAPDASQVQTMGGEAKTVGTLHNLPFRSLGGGFVGRKTEMQQLHDLLASSGSGAITDTLALEGLGGVGKTRLAVEYAWSHLADYTHIFLIRADSPESTRSGLAGLAGPKWLGLPGGEESPENERLESVLSWLEQHPKWLLILDNADDPKAAAYLSEHLLPRLKTGHVLLTTRYQRWGGQVQGLKLSPLLEDDATVWLLNATTQHRAAGVDDAAHARAIVQAVAGLPLAVEQIAAWVSHHGSSLRETLQNLQQEDSALLSWFDPREISYPRPVAAVWQQTVSLLSKEEAAVVRLLAHLSPQPVPDFFLTEAQLPGMEKKADLWPIVRRLQDRSILSERDDRATQLHRLWIELERRRTPKEEQPLWIIAALALMKKAMPLEVDDVRTWPRMQLLEAHCQQLITSTVHQSAQSLERTAWSKAARGLILVLNQVGLFWKSQDRLAESEPMFRKSLAMCEAEYGEHSPGVVKALGNLAALLEETGRLEEAEQLLQRALAICELSLDLSHPLLAMVLNNLVQVLQSTGRLSEAETVMRRAVDLFENVYGHDHPKMATALNNLARVYQDRGKLAEAEPLMRRALEIDQTSYGSCHPEIATDLNNLASVLRQLERHEEAEQIMRRALEIDKANLPQDHPEIATDLGNLGKILSEIGRATEALPLMREALRIYFEAANRSGHEHRYLRGNLQLYVGICHHMGMNAQVIWKSIFEIGSEAGWDNTRIEQMLSEVFR